MTEKQKEVMNQVDNLLREHFDGHALCVHMNDVDDTGASETLTSFNGTVMMGIGLAEYMAHKLKKRAWSEEDEREQRERQEP